MSEVFNQYAGAFTVDLMNNCEIPSEVFLSFAACKPV